MMNGEQYHAARGWLIRLGYEIAQAKTNLIPLANSDASDEEYQKAHDRMIIQVHSAANVLAEIVEQSPGDRENIRDAMVAFTDSLTANFRYPESEAKYIVSVHADDTTFVDMDLTAKQADAIKELSVKSKENDPGYGGTVEIVLRSVQ